MSWKQIGDVAREITDRLRCEHQNVRMVWTEYSNYGERYQRPQLRNYCEDCHECVGGPLKHSLANPDTPTLTREEATREQTRREEYWRERDIERERQAEQRRADYEAYLQTQEWADRRALIFTRSGGVCEGCRQAAAAEVHHLTYEHVGAEFLWELVAICRECHERVHGAGNE